MARERAPTCSQVSSMRLPVGIVAVVDVAVGERVGEVGDVLLEQRGQVRALWQRDVTVLVQVGLGGRPYSPTRCATHGSTIHKRSLRDAVLKP